MTANTVDFNCSEQAVGNKSLGSRKRSQRGHFARQVFAKDVVVNLEFSGGEESLLKDRPIGDSVEGTVLIFHQCYFNAP